MLIEEIREFALDEDHDKNFFYQLLVLQILSDK